MLPRGYGGFAHTREAGARAGAFLDIAIMHYMRYIAARAQPAPPACSKSLPQSEPPARLKYLLRPAALTGICALKIAPPATLGAACVLKIV